MLIERAEPVLSVVASEVKKIIPGLDTIELVLQGQSTFVYRIVAGKNRYYYRILPENDSFATEVLVHNVLREKNLLVPEVLSFEEKNENIGLSTMLISEIPGDSIENINPKENLAAVLFNAGKELSILHSIDVDGFGWIDKNTKDKLKGVHATFSDFIDGHLENDLQALCNYDFTTREKDKISEYIGVLKSNIHVNNPVLVHGDYDISHIFHHEGGYSGLIDFGEIRGNSRLYDLATFVGFYQDRDIFKQLLAGYSCLSGLSEDELNTVELIALSMILRFVGKKVHEKSRDHWF